MKSDFSKYIRGWETQQILFVIFLMGRKFPVIFHFVIAQTSRVDIQNSKQRALTKSSYFVRRLIFTRLESGARRRLHQFVGSGGFQWGQFFLVLIHPVGSRHIQDIPVGVAKHDTGHCQIMWFEGNDASNRFRCWVQRYNLTLKTKEIN